MTRLKKQTFRNTEWQKEAGHEFLVVNDPHALIKVVGYLKYYHGAQDSEGVYFRGQAQLHGSLCPSLYRGISNQSARDRRETQLTDIVHTVKKSAGIFDSFGTYAHEPLLQHYGIPTSWVDLVDNVWVALWFACNNAILSGKNREHLHFEQRIPSRDMQYAYVLLIGADVQSRNRMKPGYYYGEKTELVDLRVAAPSIFLRPHAQHGLVFRRKGRTSDSGRPTDYSEQIRGIVGIDLAKAIQWLGSGPLTTPHSLFPPPYYDEGYDILANLDLGDAPLGSILHVGA